jgi:PBP1b-binding outer membrane lipoprotein LpoB
MGRNKTQVEYFFQLSLTEIKSGLAIWEGETPIVKRGSSKSVSW